MRRKWMGIFCALFVGCLSVSSLFGADIVSQPAGFIRVGVPSMGRVLASTPFHAFDPGIPAILGDQLVGGSDPENSDNILKWDGTRQTYIEFWKNEKGEWLQVPSTVLSTNQLMPGEGFWVVNRQLYSQTLYLSGEVVLDDDYSVLLSESLNLLAYPYSASIALNDTTLAKDGALGGTDSFESDIITETLEQQNYWLLNDPASPYDGKWLDENSLLSQEQLNPGRAYWYNRKDNDALVWTENRPYEDPFAENGCPQILDIRPTRSCRDVTLRISAAECCKSALEIYYQDIETTGRFNAATGWKLAEEGLQPAPNTDLLWTDKGSDIREPVYKVHSRIYLVARGDIDLNGNGIPDARERFGVEVPALYKASSKTAHRKSSGQSGSVSGTISYSGSQSGQVWVTAASGETTWSTNYVTLADAQGDYTITNLPLEQTWWIKACKDANTNEQADICEPQGTYSSSIYLTNNQTDIDILLEDDETPPLWVYFGETSLVVNCDVSVDPIDIGIPVAADDRRAVSDSGLIAYYSFDNYTPGETLTDDSGQTNTGTVYGNPVVVPGMKGSALQFNGTNYVDIGDLAAVEGKYALTWGGWVNPSGVGLYGILGKMTSYNGSFYLLVDSRDPEHIGVMLVTETPYSGLTIQLPDYMQLDTWQHIMGTYDGRQVKVYFNGELIGTTSYDDYDEDAAIRSNDVVAAIADSSVGRGWLFQGKLDELRIYDRTLAADEIRRLYNESVDLSVTYSNAIIEGPCAQAKTITREWTATDACGNSTSRCQVITVQDTTTPVFVWTPANTTLTSSASTHPDFTGWPVVSDNCDSLALPEEDKLWVNEFHYDNDSTDTNEFIEIAGVSGTGLSEYRLVLYNGYNGTYYGITNLSGSIDDEGCGYGAVAFFVPGLQNGDPDGFALCRDSEVLQFISYEGSFVAADGPAAGLTSTDMGKKETTYSPVGYSLQLKGTGAMYQAFVWQSPSDDSPGAWNAGQVISPCSQGGMTLTYSDVVDAENCGTITRTWTVEDSCGNSDTAEQIITITDTNPPVMTIPVDVSLSCSNYSSPEILGYATALSASQLANLQPNEIVWINEFHYDNDGADTGEFFEVAGLAGVNLGEYTMVGYNGSGGGVYGTIPLSGVISNEGCGYGARSFAFLGMQNGSPDGLALCRNGQVVQFISYEGQITAADGPATGMTSTNISVSESNTTQIGFSLRVVGGGRGADDFRWVGPAASSPGTLNPDQYISPCSPVGLALAYTDTVTYADTVYTKTITRTWMAVDSCGNTTSAIQTITYPACDTDGDGLLDGEEVLLYGTDPDDTDSDNDGLTDGEEISMGTDPNDSADGVAMLEEARTRIIMHWNLIYTEPLNFTHSPGSPEDIEDLKDALLALSGIFNRQVEP